MFQNGFQGLLFRKKRDTGVNSCLVLLTCHLNRLKWRWFDFRIYVALRYLQVNTSGKWGCRTLHRAFGPWATSRWFQPWRVWVQRKGSSCNLFCWWVAHGCHHDYKLNGVQEGQIQCVMCYFWNLTLKHTVRTDNVCPENCNFGINASSRVAEEGAGATWYGSWSR